MSIREAARFYNIPSNALVGTWLKRFKKKWHKRTYSPQTIRATAYETEICQIPPPPKIEEDRLRLRILQLEAEVAYLKGGQNRPYRPESS